MKRIHLSFRAWLVSLTALLAALPACADVTLDQLVFTEVNGGYSVTRKSNDLEGALVIPDTYNGKPVVEIGDRAFYKCKGLTSVHIGDAVTTIGYAAFYNCKGLTSVHIGNGVTTIGDYAFIDCTGLTSVHIGDGVTTIGDLAFDGCTGLTSVTIPDAVTTIGDYAFYNCSGLTSVHIGDGVTTIGYLAFAWCSGLTSITIPDAVTTIGDRAFEGCSGLTSINIPDGVTTIGDRAFSWCSGLTQIEVSEANTAYCSIDGVVYNKAKDTIHCYPPGRQGEFSIPETVTIIGDYAFYHCSGLTSITIPDAVTTIGKRAFTYCSGLTEITCSATTPPYFYSAYYSSFDDSHYAEATVYVPEETVETYRQDENWSRFQNIVGKILTSVGRIGAESTDDAASATAVYDLRGAKVAASPEGLPQGTYIVRQGGKSKKISVK